MWVADPVTPRPPFDASGNRPGKKCRVSGPIPTHVTAGTLVVAPGVTTSGSGRGPRTQPVRHEEEQHGGLASAHPASRSAPSEVHDMSAHLPRTRDPHDTRNRASLGCENMSRDMAKLRGLGNKLLGRTRPGPPPLL